jgi:hypothetical protein
LEVSALLSPVHNAVNQRTEVWSSGPSVAVPDGSGEDGVGAGLRVVDSGTEVNAVVVGPADAGPLPFSADPPVDDALGADEAGIGFADVVVPSDRPSAVLVQPVSATIPTTTTSPVAPSRARRPP